MSPLLPGLTFLLGVAAGVAVMMLLRRVPGLRTDRDRALPRASRAKPYDPPVPPAPVPPGKTLIGPAAKKCNCIGFTFGRGDWEIDTDHVPDILADGYHGVPAGEARVCNVVVWGDPESGYDHAALVVEVSPAGVPTVVRGKAGTSRFIYEHAPAVYGPDFQVYERTNLPAPGTAARNAIDAAQAAYDAIADKTSPAAHDAAARLCQLKNALRGS